jgi:hypothetical protein
MHRLLLVILLLAGAVSVTGLTGCATNRIDWAPRVGSYTFDDAVREMGPPDKEAKLTDGTVVADWITTRGGQRFYSRPVVSRGYYGRHYLWDETYAVETPDWITRLEFGPDGKLVKHTRVVQ